MTTEFMHGRRRGAASLAMAVSAIFAIGEQLPPPPPKPLTTVPQITVLKETYNDCDRRVLKSSPVSGNCADAIPPLNSGDGLGVQHYYINTQYVTAHLIAYPNRPAILDEGGNIVIVRGEAFAVAAIVFGKDANTLSDVINATHIQAETSMGWATKRALGDSDHGEITNLRRYHFSDCGKSLQAVGKDLATFEKYRVLAHAALAVRGRFPGPMPDPTSLIKATPSDRLPLPQDDRLPGGGGVPPAPSGRRGDDAALQEMADATMQRAARDLEAAAKGAGSCAPKTLPYYWTPIYFQYSPEIGETRLRLHIDSTLTGTKDVTLTENQFKVYQAAAAGFEMPPREGNREFSFQVFAAGDLDLTGRMSLAYNQDTLSSLHRVSPATSNLSYTVTINDRAVKRVTVSGRFPFTRAYWDTDALKDVTETVAQPDDVNPIVLVGGANVAYRMEVAGFVSQSAQFTMPKPLTFALMGDSYAAGQGAPMLIPYDAWMNDDCHRSRNSGMYMAVNQFIKASTKAIDYAFVACEGATLQDILDQAQRETHEPDGTVKPSAGNRIKQPKAQVDLVKDWITDKGYARVNLVLLGVGGNNVGFAEVIQWAMMTRFLDVTTVARSQVDAGFARLNGPDGYRRVDQALRDKLDVHNVIMQGYPDVTHDADGRVCRSDCPHPDDFRNRVQQTEFEYGNSILNRLTDATRTAGSLPGWRFADILAATNNHGICVCNDIYFTTWDAAMSDDFKDGCSKGVGAVPNGWSCSFHPNARGYQRYVEPILAQLNALFGS